MIRTIGAGKNSALAQARAQTYEVGAKLSRSPVTAIAGASRLPTTQPLAYERLLGWRSDGAITNLLLPLPN